MGLKPASTALEGIVVLDLTHVRAGPVCVRQFADWGANVIKIERPGNHSDFAARHDSDYQNKHRGKRAVGLDLKSPEGQALFKQMVEHADIVVENFRPRVKHRLGIDYESLKAINPRLIYVSISAYGQDGPYAEKPGVDQVIQGMSGLMSITGEPGRGPMRAGIPLSDISAGLCAALGTFVALVERFKSGEGQWVQTSLLEAQTFMLDLQAARYLVDGDVPKQVGNEHPTGVPTGAYRTRDGYVNIAPIPAMWPRLCKALERPDLLDNPDYATRESRRARRREINDLIQAIVAEMDSATVIEKLEACEVPCGRILTVEEAYTDPQAKHLELVQTVVNAEGKSIPLPRQPVRLSRTPSTLAAATPEFAEHTDEVLAEFGIAPERIEELREAGVIQ